MECPREIFDWHSEVPSGKLMMVALQLANLKYSDHTAESQLEANASKQLFTGAFKVMVRGESLFFNKHETIVLYYNTTN